MLAETSSMTRLHPRLRLLKFTWNKEKVTDHIEFVPGLNLFNDRDQNERTIILRLIRYAMGGSNSRIDEEITKITKDVRLEFLANGKLIKTRRTFEHPTGKFPVQESGGVERLISPNEMGDYLLQILEIPRVRYQTGDRRALLSFNELARAFVVDRDFSYTEIMTKVYPEPRKETIKLMLGLMTQEIADAEEELRAADLKVQSLNEEIRGIERLLTDFKVGTLIDIQERRNNLLRVLEITQTEEDQLRQEIQTAASQGVATVQRKAEYQSLHDELLRHRSRLSDIDIELAVLEKQTTEKTDLKSLLENEVLKIERHASSHFVLSTYAFSKCPRCLREISSDMKEREHEGDCMLCGRPLQSEQDSDSEAWDKAISDARKSVQETDQLLEYYADRRTTLSQELSGIEERMAWLQNELTRQTVRYVSPLVENLSLINERRAQTLKALTGVELEENQRRYADEMRDVVLPELKRSREELRDRMEDLQVKRGKRRERAEAFITHFTYFMRQTASAQFKSASWDSNELLPLVNSQEYTKALSGFDLAISVLAFHYALLALKVKPPAFDTAHPGLLIVDEPQQQMMETHQYRSIMKLFSDLSNEYREEAQILVASTDATGFEDYLQPIESSAT
jgi:hypothetical protein